MLLGFEKDALFFLQVNPSGMILPCGALERLENSRLPVSHCVDLGGVRKVECQGKVKSQLCRLIVRALGESLAPKALPSSHHTHTHKHTLKNIQWSSSMQPQAQSSPVGWQQA